MNNALQSKVIHKFRAHVAREDVAQDIKRDCHVASGMASSQGQMSLRSSTPSRFPGPSTPRSLTPQNGRSQTWIK